MAGTVSVLPMPGTRVPLFAFNIPWNLEALE